jgi:hypothetical protein
VDKHVLVLTEFGLAASANEIGEPYVITKIAKRSRKIMFFLVEWLVAITKAGWLCIDTSACVAFLQR